LVLERVVERIVGTLENVCDVYSTFSYCFNATPVLFFQFGAGCKHGSSKEDEQKLFDIHTIVFYV
jgi:FPC/CPF motif-containing protein YcgG